jgi:hypothetical protein
LAVLRPLPHSPSPPPSLEARIRSLQLDIDAYIDAKVAELKVENPGLPLQTIRNTLTHEGCLCRSYFQVAAQEPGA